MILLEQQRAIDAAAPTRPEELSIFVRAPVDPDVVVLETLTVSEQFNARRLNSR